jgi:FAD/FMN-containing dehydrogenase
MDNSGAKLKSLGESLDGDLRYDTITRTIYSTDASVYKEMPLATAWPKSEADIKKLLKFAAEENTSVTVRAAGTSLAGQVVSGGIIMDISKYLTKIIEVNAAEKWVRVQPGVVLDELNKTLKSYGLFFGPETSTANRCNIGGMVGNNACGLHSLVYGSTRDHTLEVKAILSDGSEAVFSPVEKKTFEAKCGLENLEGNLYRNIREILSDQVNSKTISEEYPDPSVKRRNTGYALDILLNSELFNQKSESLFNFSNLITGSEGTLAIVTEIKLNLIPLPPDNKALVCVHLNKRNDSFRANLIALKYNPSAVELMDDRILALTDNNIGQRKNRFFIEGNPGAILIVEFVRETTEEINDVISAMVKDLQACCQGKRHLKSVGFKESGTGGTFKYEGRCQAGITY